MKFKKEGSLKIHGETSLLLSYKVISLSLGEVNFDPG